MSYKYKRFKFINLIGVLSFVLFTSIFVCRREPVLAIVSEELNNKVDASEDPIKKVWGESSEEGDNNTILNVELNSETDKIALYRIADVTWDSTEECYGELTWNETIQQWIEDSETFNTSVYETPTALSAASKAKWEEFFQSLLADKEVLDAIGAAANNDDDAVNTEVNGKHYAKFSNLLFGSYAVIVTNSTYNPVVIDLVPSMIGPVGEYGIKYEYNVSLKESLSTISKRINNEKKATVAVGDKVNFDITFEYPSHGERITVSNDDSAKEYCLFLRDQMSKAFALAGNASGIVVKYRYPKAGEDETGDGDLPASEEDYISGILANDLITYQAKCTADYIPKDGEIKTQVEEDYYVTKTGHLYEISTDEALDDMGEDVTEIAINFNMSALDAWFALDTTPSSISHIDITYDAFVTDEIEVGSEANYNTVSLTYEKSASSFITAEITDTVYAYTYGLRVKKLNGSSADEVEEMDPLAGAEFSLYKETHIYVGGAWKGRLTNVTHATEAGENSGIHEVIDNSTEPEMSLTQFRDDTTNYYVWDETAERDGVVPGTSIAYHEGDVISRVFELVKLGQDGERTFDGSFVSNGEAEGNLISGLNIGNYILKETLAPGGFNTLAEDIYFRIIRLNDGEAELVNKGSLSAFYEIDKESADGVALNEGGITEITVLNYKGLRLPTTGGTGTLLFTMVGLLIMASVFVIILLRGQKKYEIYYK